MYVRIRVNFMFSHACGQMELMNLRMFCAFSCSSLDNDIGPEGAQALAEGLKQNTTLTRLNLEGMSELE